jgi:hypothetical protein
MTRFATAVILATVAMTAIGVGVIIWVDDATEERLLTADDFRRLGLHAIDFRQEELRLPGGEIRRRYLASLGPESDASVEVRLGVARSVFADELAREVRESARITQDGSLHTMIEEQWGGTSAFVTRRVDPDGPGARIEVLLWALEGNTLVIARVQARGVLESNRAEQVHAAELQVRALATLAVEHVVDQRRRRER